MSHRCDVCESYRPEANQRERELTPVTFGEQTVVLCEMHRLIAERAGVTTFEGLREHYGEPGDGRRSYVPRRGRGQSAAPDVERRRAGRRSTDVP
jgi:hypothetical protein